MRISVERTPNKTERLQSINVDSDATADNATNLSINGELRTLTEGGSGFALVAWAEVIVGGDSRLKREQLDETSI